MENMRRYKVQVDIDHAHRKRLDMVRAIICMGRDGLATVTWSDCIEWMLDAIPLDRLLAEYASSVRLELPKENENGNGQEKHG